MTEWLNIIEEIKLEVSGKLCPAWGIEAPALWRSPLSPHRFADERGGAHWELEAYSGVGEDGS